MRHVRPLRTAMDDALGQHRESNLRGWLPVSFAQPPS
jgi:hypothetical protein